MGDDELAEFGGEDEFLRLIGVNERGDESESVVIGLTDRSPVF